MEESCCLPPLSKALLAVHVPPIESPSRLTRRRIDCVPFNYYPDRRRPETSVALLSCFLIFTEDGAHYTATSTVRKLLQVSSCTASFDSLVFSHPSVSSGTFLNRRHDYGLRIPKSARCSAKQLRIRSAPFTDFSFKINTHDTVASAQLPNDTVALRSLSIHRIPLPGAGRVRWEGCHPAAEQTGGDAALPGDDSLMPIVALALKAPAPCENKTTLRKPT